MAKAKKLPSGQWRTLVYDYTETLPNGKKKRHYESFTADTKAESELMAAEFANTKKRKTSSNMTVLESMEQIINLKENVLSPTTLREYRRLKEKAYDSIKDFQIRKLDKITIQGWVNSYAKEHSPKSTKNAYQFLNSAIHLVDEDINFKITLPQAIRKETYTPTDEDIRLICDFVKENDREMLIILYLGAFGGLRRSEMCALSSDDIRPGNRIIINKGMVDDGENWIIKNYPKNDSSNRTVTYPAFVMEVLPTSGQFINITPDAVTARFRKIVKKCNVPYFRLHDLRHYTASILHALGIPDEYIMKVGGWSSDYVMKSRYRGVMTDYEKKFEQKQLEHFESMQHEMQHKKIKAQ